MRRNERPESQSKRGCSSSFEISGRSRWSWRISRKIQRPNFIRNQRLYRRRKSTIWISPTNQHMTSHFQNWSSKTSWKWPMCRHLRPTGIRSRTPSSTARARSTSPSAAKDLRMTTGDVRSCSFNITVSIPRTYWPTRVNHFWAWRRRMGPRIPRCIVWRESLRPRAEFNNRIYARREANTSEKQRMSATSRQRLSPGIKPRARWTAILWICLWA